MHVARFRVGGRGIGSRQDTVYGLTVKVAWPVVKFESVSH